MSDLYTSGDRKRMVSQSAEVSDTKLHKMSAVVFDDFRSGIVTLPFTVASVTSKQGLQVPVDVNKERDEELQSLRASEPVLWYDAEFDREQEIEGMKKEMQSLTDFQVYEEVKLENLTEPLLPNGSND